MNEYIFVKLDFDQGVYSQTLLKVIKSCSSILSFLTPNPSNLIQQSNIPIASYLEILLRASFSTKFPKSSVPEKNTRTEAS